MDTVAIREDWVGRVIDGRFPLLQWLGGSESGDVFLTELQGHPSHKAAIKLIAADSVDAETYVAGWAATMSLSHPRLMRLFHTGHCRIDAVELLYVVTEYAEEVLSEIIPERPLTPTEAREMLKPVIDALSFLHGKGFVHGHLKPSNIMVIDDQIKLSADTIHAEGDHRKHFPALRIYRAPETATGAISPAADLWSLGVTLVEALTQHPPVWDRSVSREPVVPESVPQPFAAIAQGCLRPEPATRCTLGDVEAFLKTSRPLPAPVKTTARNAPAKLGLTSFVAAALVLFAVIAILLSRTHLTRPTSPAEEQQAAPAVAVAPSKNPQPARRTSKGPSPNSAIVQRVLPDVPRFASETIHGSFYVIIRVTVDSSGNVSDAVFDIPGPSKYFANLARQAARQWRFNPAQVSGQAVPSEWILRFQFKRSGVEVTPIEKSP